MKKYYVFRNIGGDEYYNVSFGKDSYADAVEYIKNKWKDDDEYNRERGIYSIVQILDTLHFLEYAENKIDKL